MTQAPQPSRGPASVFDGIPYPYCKRKPESPAPSAPPPPDVERERAMMIVLDAASKYVEERADLDEIVRGIIRRSVEIVQGSPQVSAERLRTCLWRVVDSAVPIEDTDCYTVPIAILDDLAFAATDSILRRTPEATGENER